MNQPKILDLYEVATYVEENIGAFHLRRLESLQALKLDKILSRKNPYLFKAKNILTAEMLIRGILDAHLSSQEETLFGEFLEGIAQFVNNKVYGGYKPPQGGHLTGIDLVFEADNVVYMVEIKSGPNWGNASQLKKMLENFEQARATLTTHYPDRQIIAVNGCSYGTDSSPRKRNGLYWKLCGQDFWQFISNNENLYTDIIEPFGYKAQEKNKEFMEAYSNLINKLTLEFSLKYCNADGAINWQAIVEFTSKRDGNRKYPFDDPDENF